MAQPIATRRAAAYRERAQQLSQIAANEWREDERKHLLSLAATYQRRRSEPDWNGRDQTKIGNMASQTKLRCDVEQRSFPKNGCKTDINTAQNPV